MQTVFYNLVVKRLYVIVVTSIIGILWHASALAIILVKSGESFATNNTEPGLIIESEYLTKLSKQIWADKIYYSTVFMLVDFNAGKNWSLANATGTIVRTNEADENKRKYFLITAGHNFVPNLVGKSNVTVSFPQYFESVSMLIMSAYRYPSIIESFNQVILQYNSQVASKDQYDLINSADRGNAIAEMIRTLGNWGGRISLSDIVKAEAGYWNGVAAYIKPSDRTRVFGAYINNYAQSESDIDIAVLPLKQQEVEWIVGKAHMQSDLLIEGVDTVGYPTSLSIWNKHGNLPILDYVQCGFSKWHMHCQIFPLKKDNFTFQRRNNAGGCINSFDNCNFVSYSALNVDNYSRIYGEKGDSGGGLFRCGALGDVRPLVCDLVAVDVGIQKFPKLEDGPHNNDIYDTFYTPLNIAEPYIASARSFKF